MPLEIVRNDITKMAVDAIVNAANEELIPGGGVDGAIHKAAGKELYEECKSLKGCKTGDAKITKGYNLPCRYVIHTVGPVYIYGSKEEKNALISCYKKSLELAKQHKCETVAFPLISSGIFGYPKDKALKIAVDTIGNFLLHNDMTVYLVVFDKNAFKISEKLFSDISEYIDDNYVDLHEDKNLRTRREFGLMPCAAAPCASVRSDSKARHKAEAKDFCNSELDDKLKEIDESFSQMLLRKIDEQGMTDSQCYKKANVDRKLFSKIRGDVNYKPSKPTALAFAIALELSLSETEDLLKKAGFALSHSNKADIIIEYFITKGIYNIYDINEALFAFDQHLLGA